LQLNTGGGSKRQNDRISPKIVLRLKKVCYKVSICENCQRQCCKAFTGLSICVKMIGGGRPLLTENLEILTHPLQTQIFSLFSLAAPQP